jgi:hypothetical protein
MRWLERGYGPWKNVTARDAVVRLDEDPVEAEHVGEEGDRARHSGVSAMASAS